MKVNDIIWAEFVDDDTVITIFDFYGKTVSSSAYIIHRFYEDVEIFGEVDAYKFSYFPGYNRLYITLDVVFREAENDYQEAKI